MGSFSDYTEGKVLEHIVGKTSFAMPTAYVALSTADPTDSAAGMAEPVGNNYARKATAGADWNAKSGTNPTLISNVNDITFAAASGSWGTITHFALYDQLAAGGNMLAYGTLTVSKAVTNGDTVKFAGGTPGDLQLTLD
jgi:hypothetical protein